MILSFMTQDAVDVLKSNLPYVYKNYLHESSNQWIFDLMQDNGIETPFKKYKEIEDFELCSVDLKALGKVDLNNSKILYSRLKFLTPSQAGDERFWAGLEHTIFYDYVRKRFGYGQENRRPTRDEQAAIKTRFFFTTGRSACFRNSLAKYWWVGYLTYDEMQPQNPFHWLEDMGSHDFATKVNDIFNNNNFTSNPTVLHGILEALSYFKKQGIDLPVQATIRPAMQMLNVEAGTVILDALPQEDITHMTKNLIHNALKKIEKY
jgi:hypothetical protein